MSPDRAPEISQESVLSNNYVSSAFYEASLLTYDNRPELIKVGHDNFSGLRTIPLDRLENTQDLELYVGADGVGHKIEVAERLEDHSTIAYDLFAMVCDDASAKGIEPLAVVTILDIKQPDDTESTRRSIGELMSGYVAAARASQVVIPGGETAILRDRVSGHGPFSYNWSAAAIGVAHKERKLTGYEIKPGDSLVGLVEPGFRSNGYTKLLTAMSNHYGSDWHNKVDKDLGPETLGRMTLRPSTIYTKLITSLTGGYDIEKEPKAKITGLANITGGGQPEKLERMLLPSGLGAIIDDPIEPLPIMLKAQKLLDMDDREAYQYWHFGPGMIVVTPEPEKVIAEAASFDIDAKRVGEVIERRGIWIENRGALRDEELLRFP